MGSKISLGSVASAVLLACTIVTTGMVAWPHVAAALTLPEDECIRGEWGDGSCRPVIHRNYNSKTVLVGEKKLEFTFSSDIRISEHAGNMMQKGDPFRLFIALEDANNEALWDLSDTGTDIQGRSVLPFEIDNRLRAAYGQRLQDALLKRFVAGGMTATEAEQSFEVIFPRVERRS